MASFLKFAGAVILVLGSSLQAFSEDPMAAVVGGHAVDADEFAFYADQLRTEVASRIMREHGLEQSATFWSTPVNGVSPEAVLHAEILHAIARARAIQELAVNAGIIDEMKSFPQLVEAFHAENQRRKAMKERGEIFYGPVQYRLDVWVKVWFEQLLKALQKTVGPDIDQELEALMLTYLETPNP
jgi:hypothetical protein